MDAQRESSDSSAGTRGSSSTPWRPSTNPWLIAVVVAIASFMEFLDTSIANGALPHMAGNLGASNDESTWILTSYLASNAIVLPLSGWSERRVRPLAASVGQVSKERWELVWR